LTRYQDLTRIENSYDDYKERNKSIMTKSKSRILIDSLNNYKKGFLLLLIVLIATVGINSFEILLPGLISVNAQSFKTFENAFLGAKVLFPPDWSVEFKGTTATFKSPSGTSAIQLYGILVGDDDINPKEAAEIEIDTKKLYGQNFQVLNKGSTTINGNDFYSLLLGVQFDNGLMVKNLYLFTTVDETPYVFKLETLNDPRDQALTDQLYSEGLNILQYMVTSAELRGLNLDILKEDQGDNFDPFESGPSDLGGSGGSDSNKDVNRDNNNGGGNTFPQQQPSQREPSCGQGSCIIS
jgi:hypothetical protein